MSEQAARPYAAAAFAFAKAENALAAWGEMFATLAASGAAVCSAVKTYPGHEAALAETLAELLKLKNEGQKNFLRILAQNRRMENIGAVARQFEEMYLDEQNVAKLRVESARPMNGKEQKEFNKFLAQKYGREVRAEYSENPELLGGVRIYRKNNVLDASVRGRLDRLAAALT